MKVEIESIVCNFSSKALNNSWADEISHILIRVINAITLSANEEKLRAAIKKIAEETERDLCPLSLYSSNSIIFSTFAL